MGSTSPSSTLPFTPVIPLNSLILVTGANGFIASHIVDQLLSFGYRVRGTTRSFEKVKPLAEIWEKKYGAGRFEAVLVLNMSVVGAFDEALKDVEGVLHVATDASFSPDPNIVITYTVSALTHLLTSTLSHPSVKRFIYTSSSVALTDALPLNPLKITSSTWNHAAIKAAWAPPPYEDSRKWAVYAASKTESEMALWKFVEEKKPAWIGNAILPNANFGRIIGGEGQWGSTAEWIKSLWFGDVDSVKGVDPK